jgi:hypothetical protein
MTAGEFRLLKNLSVHSGPFACSVGCTRSQPFWYGTWIAAGLLPLFKRGNTFAAHSPVEDRHAAPSMAQLGRIVPAGAPPARNHATELPKCHICKAESDSNGSARAAVTARHAPSAPEEGVRCAGQLARRVLVLSSPSETEGRAGRREIGRSLGGAGSV